MKPHDAAIDHIVAHYTPDQSDGLGVVSDELMDYTLTARDYESRWQDVYLSMDAMIDNGELLPAYVIEDVTETHKRARELTEFYGDLADAFAEKLEQAHAELREVSQ